MMVLENNLECLLLSKKETQPDTVCLLIEVHNRSELRHATFWTHSPALSLTPGALTLVGTFPAIWEERLLLLQQLPHKEGFVRAVSWVFRLLLALLSGASLWECRPWKTLWIHIKCVVGVNRPWAALPVTERSWWINYSLPHSMGFGGNNFLGFYKDFWANWDNSHR